MTSFNKNTLYAFEDQFQDIKNESDFYTDVIEGLSKSPKALPCKYFYDERGSLIFTEICNTEEYYVTRTEGELTEKILPELAGMIGPNATFIEFGSGEGKKIRSLLAGMDHPLAYVPIDISAEILNRSAIKLKTDFKNLAIYPVVADYMNEIQLPPQITSMNNRKIVYFPGSTISNFTPREASLFFSKVNACLKPGDGFIIGVDLIKSPARLHCAYNDAEGVTRKFDLNILQRINRELGGNFNPEFFEHYAFFNPVKHRIEMHLVSLCDHWVHIGTNKFHFDHGESIHTENSYKYTLEDVGHLGAESGFKNCKTWTDAEKLFSISFLMKL
ncbi:MAG TPA: L-histidine N(alpha)-methyltransferase [Cellvibrio sp.]|nr:L-histidine N(alpha)-methyltransferase [Cellvibrio sp.]